MVEKKHILTWTKRSITQLGNAHKYIKNDSPQNADKVVSDISLMLEKAIANPEIYAPDKYKINNDGSYRAFEKHRYRVSYRFTNNIIRVLRVRHTKMKPLMY